MTTDTSTTAPFDEYRSASPDGLRELLGNLADRTESTDRELHILAARIDRESVAAQVDALTDTYGSLDPASRPPLYGVPVGVKDIFRIGGAEMRCGSLLPPSLLEGEEADCVRLLREAGAVIFARTATTEFAYFEPAATRNPHNPTHTPGGSSSGSAAGVAAGTYPVALGSQTVGSVIRPASYCGVVGFKPSYGLIPAGGTMFFSRSVDHVGFFCRSVAEARTIMTAFAPGWENPASPESLRLGIPVGPYMDQLSTEAAAWFDRVLGRLADLGVEAVPVACLENLDAVDTLHDRLTAAELAQEHAAWFPDFEHLYRPRTREKIWQGHGVGADEVEAGRASRLNLRRKLTALMAEHGLDAWVCPATLDEAPEGLGSTGSPAMNLPWTHSGMPAVTLPGEPGAGGLPRGVQLVGAFGGDARLLALAAVLEPGLKS